MMPNNFIHRTLVARDVFDKFFDLLTNRQKQIARQIFIGKTAEEIGSLLNISKRTVTTHREVIFHKYGLLNIKEFMHYVYYLSSLQKE